ncbi:G-protein coupled receptor 4 [Amia ocellicauda]|uniref:G-protein coupled receptor 4 n=1 Tax=Amia ocellicauda TaxID=2972642 RepID=UPI003464AEAF
MDLTPNQTVSNGSNGPLNNSCGIDFGVDAVFLPVFYGIFFFVGLPLNLMALYGLYRLVKSENVLPVYVMNLLLSDLLQIVTLPLWIDYYSKGHYWQFGTRLCQVVGLVFYISLYAGIFFLCLIALERHLAIARPLKFQSLRRLRYARWVALGLWVVVALPPCIAFAVLFTKNNQNHLCIEKYPSDKQFIIYRLVTLVLSFAIPFIFIVTLHMLTLRSLAGVSSLVEEEKKRIRRLLTMVVVIFLTVLGPYHLIGCVKYIGLLIHPISCEWERSVFVYYQMGRALLSLNSLLDPVLYIFLRNDFRDKLYSSLCCLGRLQRRSHRPSPAVSDHVERQTNSTQDSNM